MPSYFQSLQDAEISGGDFASIGGDYVVAGEVRHTGGPKEKSEPTSYFANAKGLKITGGNFMTVGGNFYQHGGARSPSPIPPPPRPSSVAPSPQYGNYGFPIPGPSTLQRPAVVQQPLYTQSAPRPPSAPPQQAFYNHQGGEDPTGLQGYHAPYTSQAVAQQHPPPLADTNSVRPSILYSQSGPSGQSHLSANLAAPVEFRHTLTEPTPPSHTESLIRPQPLISGLDVPNHRPMNLNPSVDIWAQRPGEPGTEPAESESDSLDGNQKKKKRTTPSVAELREQFKKVFIRPSTGE